ncbi:MAG: POTRA domain-containing protein, partial [Thermodesulfovibrionales bacterium]
MKQDEFLELLGFKIHDKLDPVSVRHGIKRTYLTDRFENIIVLQDDHDPGSIVIKVMEKYVVDKIVIEGTENITKKDILKEFSIKEKDLFEEQRLEPALRVLEKNLAEMGYPGTRVRSSVKSNDKRHNVKIKLIVDEGKPLIIKRINVKGIDDQEEIDRALIILDVFTGDIFNGNKIREKLRGLRDRYKKDGYYNPTVRPFDYSDGVLTLNIDLGKLLVVKFKGDTYFAASRLREETLFKDVESIDNEVVEEASARIVTLYRETGFAFAQVAPVIKEEEGSAEVVFFIFEGNQVYIDKVDISGNSINDELIRDILSIE